MPRPLPPASAFVLAFAFRPPHTNHGCPRSGISDLGYLEPFYPLCLCRCICFCCCSCVPNHKPRVPQVPAVFRKGAQPCRQHESWRDAEKNSPGGAERNPRKRPKQRPLRPIGMEEILRLVEPLHGPMETCQEGNIEIVYN